MTLKVAILGAGIGQAHMAGYLSHADEYEVVMVCDRDIERASALAAEASGCRATPDINEALADPAIDLIDICLPPHLHASVATKALAAGKHVICEKPIAGSVLEADRIVDAVRAHGRSFFPVFQYRYGRGLYQLSALQDRGLLGRPLVATLETHWNRQADYYAAAWRGSWSGERGGAILSHAIHIHDLVTRFFGACTEVSAMLDTRVNPIETEDCAAIAMRTASGGLVTSSVTLGASDDTSRLRLVFENVTAESGRNPYAPGEDEWVFSPRHPDCEAAVQEVLTGMETDIADRPVGFAGQFMAVARSLRGEEADIVTVEDGIRSIEFVAAIYESARSARRISLPLDRSLPICADWTPQNDTTKGA